MQQYFIIKLVIVCYLCKCAICTEEGDINDINRTKIEQLPSYDNSNVIETVSPEHVFENVKETVNNTIQLLALEESKNITEVTSNNTSLKENVVACKKLDLDFAVDIVNASQLLKLLRSDPNVTSKESIAPCMTVLFYGESCPFSAAAAAPYNALQRHFPHINMVAIDAMTHHIFNAQNGIVGVPTLMLFHNGRAVAKYNETEFRIELLMKFIAKHTGMEDVDSFHYLMVSTDFFRPLSSTPKYQTDYCLGLSWLFIITCGLYLFSKSKWYQWIVETVQNTWREAEAQHEHTD